MSTNSQVFPQSTWPLAGDLSSSPGSAVITVSGIENTPVDATKPTDGQTLVYSAALSRYIPSSSPANQSLKVNGLPVSDDYWFFVQRIDTEVQVNSSHPPNGFPVLVNGSVANVS